MDPHGSAALFPVWVPSGLDAQLLLEPPEGSAFHTDQGSLPLLAWEEQERWSVRPESARREEGGSSELGLCLLRS